LSREGCCHKLGLMATSLIYRSRFVYNLVMRALYGKHYDARHQAVSDLIPPGANVLELCCGTAVLYDRYLRKKHVNYRGLDINRKFIDVLVERGGSGEVWDLRSDKPLPPADYVIMQGSLCQFLPEASEIIDRMLRAALKQVVIAEPIRNLASSRIPVVAFLASRLTDPGVGPQAHRFTEQTFDKLAKSYGTRLKQLFLIPGGREKVCVLEP
jgi:hypothetical protein